MQIEKLANFIAVADVCSINKAAEKMHISQQALSQMIHGLEKELDMQLFLRTNKGVELTKNGRLLYDTAQEILQAWTHFHKATAPEPLTSQKKIDLNFSMPILLEERYAVRLLSAAHDAYPQLCLHFFYEDYETGLRLLQAKERHIVLGAILKKATDYEDIMPPGLMCIELHREHLCVCVSKQSVIANLQTISLEKLRTQQITLNAVENYQLDQFLRKEGCCNITFVHSITTLRQMVENNLAVTIDTLSSPVHPKTKLLPFEEALYAITNVYFQQGFFEDDVLRWLLSQITACH